MPAVRTLRPAAEAMRRHATAAWPDEACGAVFGRRSTAGTLVATRHVQLRNVAARPRESFALDALELCLVEGAERDAGRELLGVFHSHPHGPARPSRADRAGAWPGFAVWIAAPDLNGTWRLCCVRLAGASIAGPHR